MEEEDQQTLEDKLSFTSPTSMNAMMMRGVNGKRLGAFNEKDNSMSVSKIEEVNEQN